MSVCIVVVMDRLNFSYVIHVYLIFLTDLREGMSSPMGRDALEESPSRPESEELSPADFPSNRDQTTLSQETPPRLVTFDPNIGLSSGGLKETRIGAVGTSRDLNQQQKDGLHADVSAQMY